MKLSRLVPEQEKQHQGVMEAADSFDKEDACTFLG
jgi:hypothetical protein